MAATPEYSRKGCYTRIHSIAIALLHSQVERGRGPTPKVNGCSAKKKGRENGEGDLKEEARADKEDRRREELIGKRVQVAYMSHLFGDHVHACYSPSL